MSGVWQALLVGALCVNALLGFGYRVYRLSKGGPLGDVLGQAILGVLLLVLAVSLIVGVGWTRWIAFGYGLLFAVVVMPIWTLAVLIPMRPRVPDYAFTSVYWAGLVVIILSALLA